MVAARWCVQPKEEKCCVVVVVVRVDVVVVVDVGRALLHELPQDWTAAIVFELVGSRAATTEYAR